MFVSCKGWLNNRAPSLTNSVRVFSVHCKCIPNLTGGIDLSEDCAISTNDNTLCSDSLPENFSKGYLYPNSNTKFAVKVFRALVNASTRTEELLELMNLDHWAFVKCYGYSIPAGVLKTGTETTTLAIIMKQYTHTLQTVLMQEAFTWPRFFHVSGQLLHAVSEMHALDPPYYIGNLSSNHILMTGDEIKYVFSFFFSFFLFIFFLFI
jgi:hypothetical protein